MTGTSLPWLAIVLWAANVIVDSAGQLAFKAAAINDADAEGLTRWYRMAQQPWLWLGIGCYVLEFVLWLAFLSLVPLSQGVLMGSINIVAIMLAGRWLFRERLTRLRVIGILLVSLGVAIVGLPA
ncbi:EamA family transporter [Herminiimonas sp. NPDC097707]|uniref:EamA family transporter n=1 Tax=Herminiimonas sp. NPDC097707 TaxID=3364007 RepID=UPI00383A81B3